MKIRRIDFSPDEWIAGCVMLTNAERGLYITACALIYSNGGAIERAHLRAASTDHGIAFNRQLQHLIDLGKLIETGSRIDQERCENELRKAEERSENARRNGSKGGRPNGLDNPRLSAPVKLTTNYQPSTIKESPPKAPRKRGVMLDGFEEWYSGFPHKVNRGAAERAWPHARKLASVEELTEGVRRYIETKPPDQSWCGPGPWLNGKRWTDHPAPPPTPKGQLVLPNGLATAGEDVWRRRLRDFAKSKFWMSTWGFPPDDPDCYAPAALLVEFGFAKVEHAISR